MLTLRHVVLTLNIGALLFLFCNRTGGAATFVVDELAQLKPVVDDNAAAAAELQAVVPGILAMTWQKGDGGGERFSGIPLWTPDGKLLTETDAAALKAEIFGTEVHHMGQLQSRPLVFIFDVGIKLKDGVGGVIVKCELPDGTLTSGGMTLNRASGKRHPENMYAVSAATQFFRRGQPFAWPESANVILKYPIEEPVLLQTLDEVPLGPLEIADGVVWYVDPTAGYDTGAPRIVNQQPNRFPAAVLDTITDGSLDFVSYHVRVYAKGEERPLRGGYTTIVERKDKQYRIDVSHRFPDFDNIDRIEVYRQRFTQTVIPNVRMRTDLLPESADDQALSDEEGSDQTAF